MNAGEKQELLIKIYLIYLRDKDIDVVHFGKIEQVGFDSEYKKIDRDDFNIERLIDKEDQIKEIAEELNILKAKPNDKADIKINNIFYSLKYIGHAMPSIVNHTTRIGWLNVAKRKNLNIDDFDVLIKNYWKLRKNKEIAEDCPNTHPKSPFKDGIKIIKPFLDYFLFKGTGKSDSAFPAERILEFDNFNNVGGWKIFGKEYLKEHWSKLYFCMRSKNMPKDYENYKHKDLISSWTEKFKGKKGKEKYRGALSVRVG